MNILGEHIYKLVESKIKTEYYWPIIKKSLFYFTGVGWKLLSLKQKTALLWSLFWLFCTISLFVGFILKNKHLRRHWIDWKFVLWYIFFRINCIQYKIRAGLNTEFKWLGQTQLILQVFGAPLKCLHTKIYKNHFR